MNFHQLAKVQWAFVNSQKFNEILLFLTEEYECIVDSHQLAKVRRCIGESTRDSRQLAKVLDVYWQNYSGLSPIGETPRRVLAKVKWTLANWRKSLGYIGESTVDFRHWRMSGWRKSYWRNSGKPNELVLYWKRNNSLYSQIKYSFILHNYFLKPVECISFIRHRETLLLVADRKK